MRDGGDAHDARDAEDRALLASGDYATLLACYYETIRERCFFRLRSRDAGDEAAHTIVIRLAGELKRGKPYPVPFRVVVWMVTDYMLRGWPGEDDSVGLPEDWDSAGPDVYAEIESRYYLWALFQELPKREREVLELRYLLHHEPSEIARMLEMEANAVYAAIFRGHAKLEEKLREELRA
jgi:DNA-directed RNA polymerase specialized sigma24 family protein